MKLLVSIALLAISTVPVLADPCHDRFSDLLINGNSDMGPSRVHITQEIVSGKTSLNYHYSDGRRPRFCWQSYERAPIHRLHV
jgi:hypothetical protein